MSKQPRFDFDRNERRAALDNLAAVYTPPKGSNTSRAACIRVLRCIESHLGRDDRGALADEWRLTFETIASETGMSDRSVRYAVYQLERDHLIYLTEHRLTGWRSHSYRIIWGNVEAAAEVKEEIVKEPEKPKTVERGDRERGVKSSTSAPLPLAPAPLPLGMAAVATRSGNPCHSSIQKQELNQIPPPPPTPCEPVHPNGWKEVEEALRKLGLGTAKDACRNARERGATPDDIRAVIAEWNASKGFWSLGGLAWRVANGIWPPPNKIAQSKATKAAELRERLRRKGHDFGYTIEHINFVIGMELRREGLGEWMESEEADAVAKRKIAV